jgi:phosphoribosyl-AMP cyclohydrolase
MVKHGEKALRNKTENRIASEELALRLINSEEPQARIRDSSDASPHKGKSRASIQRVSESECGLDRLLAAFHGLAMNTENVFAKRGVKAELEEGVDFAPKFDGDGLIPAMAMDATTREPLMLAYMNAESLRRTLEIGEAVYWSRSRQEFWHKGATSGHIQRIVEIRTDCDQDALVLFVEQIGAGACHTGRNSCFYRKVTSSAGGLNSKLEPTGLGKSFDPDQVYGKH